LVAIDGLPCSGKTTFAERLAASLELPILSLDEFVVPPAERPTDLAPAFPFPFFRTDLIRSVVRTLSLGEAACFHPYDFETERLTTKSRKVKGPLIVEGCSLFSNDLAQFDIRLWVESEERTMVAAQRARDGDRDADKWRDLYLPSVEIYMRTMPDRLGTGCSESEGDALAGA
jgi:uridine kinase